MKTLKHFLLVSFTVCMFPVMSVAQEMTDGYYLDLTPDAQSTGMGSTGLATTDNSSAAIFHNASTIAFSMEMMGATYGYTNINKDWSMHSASLFYRIGREGKHGFAIGFRHFKDPKSETNNNFRPRVWDIEAGYFRSITMDFSLSLTLRYLQSKAYQNANTKNTACVDIGATYHHDMSMLDDMASWNIGFQAANLGGKLNGEKLPARLGLGGSIDMPFNMENKLQVALDFQYLLPSEYRHLQAGIGAEYSFMKYGVVRGGYHFGDENKGTGSYGTLGCGINFWPIRADFSYTLAGEEYFMHNTWQLSIGISL